MPKIMLINVTHAEESRVGIIAEGILESFEIETFSREHLKGNIYKGIVHRIHPALEAAFVDIGADRDAFLPLDEICFRNLPGAVVRDGGNGGENRRRLRIKDLLKPGEDVLVQIAKEEFGNKPPTLTTFYSLPGRYLVLLPGSEDAGISRKIEGTERVRIRELIASLEPPGGFGIIVRTAASFDQGAQELHRDLTYLLRLWEAIQHTAAVKRAPALVYREHDLVLRNIRDYFTPDIDEIYIDNEEVFQRARDFLREVLPGKENVLHLYKGDQPIFSHFNVEAQIESIYKRRVPLKSGGGIVIDGTEALTAIDVNSGRSVRGSNQEETAFRTNVEAAAEIARQLRLRDLGGLIVIDFIDMRSSQHVAEVERVLREGMRPEKARHEIGHISQFGLLQISRQRLRPAAAATSYTACPMCEGHGLVRTTESAALVALRKIHNRVAQGDAAAVRVSLPPDVAVYLLNQKRDDLAQLERRYAARIQVALNAALMSHQCELETRTRVEGGQPRVPQIRLGGVAPTEPAVAAEALPSDNGSAASATADGAADASARPADAGGTGKRRRRRRGRRRGRGKQAAAAIGETFAALGAATSLAPVRHEPAEAVGAHAAAAEQEPPASSPPAAPFVDTARARHTSVTEAGPAAADAPLHAAELPGTGASKRRTPKRTSRRGGVGRRRRKKPVVTAAGTAANDLAVVEAPKSSDHERKPVRRRTRHRQAVSGRTRRGRSSPAPSAPESGT